MSCNLTQAPQSFCNFLCSFKKDILDSWVWSVWVKVRVCPWKSYRVRLGQVIDQGREVGDEERRNPPTISDPGEKSTVRPSWNSTRLLPTPAMSMKRTIIIVCRQKIFQQIEVHPTLLWTQIQPRKTVNEISEPVYPLHLVPGQKGKCSILLLRNFSFVLIRFHPKQNFEQF